MRRAKNDPVAAFADKLKATLNQRETKRLRKIVAFLVNSEQDVHDVCVTEVDKDGLAVTYKLQDEDQVYDLRIPFAATAHSVEEFEMHYSDLVKESSGGPPPTSIAQILARDQFAWPSWKSMLMSHLTWLFLVVMAFVSQDNLPFGLGVVQEWLGVDTWIWLVQTLVMIHILEAVVAAHVAGMLHMHPISMVLTIGSVVVFGVHSLLPLLSRMMRSFSVQRGDDDKRD